MISPGARGGTLARMTIGCGQTGAGTDRGDKSSDQFAWSANVIALTEVGLLSHLLAQYFLTRFARENGRDFKGLTPDAIAAISDWPWPGNVRELENRMKRAVIMAEGSRLTAADLDLVNSSDEAALTLKVARETADRQAIRRAMLRVDGNVSTAAKFLGVSRPTL